MENRNEAFEIDLIDLFYYLKKKIWIVAIAFVLCAVIGAMYTVMLVDTEYTAATRMYVLNRSSENSLSSSDYSISNYMISDYEVLITGQNVTGEVIERLGLDMPVSVLAGKISVSAVKNTRILQIEVVDTNAKRAADIANCVREVASRQIKEIVNVEAVNLVYEAEVPQVKSGPSLTKNTVIAAALGLIAAVGVLVVIYMLDDTIRTEEDVERYLGLGILGVIPISDEMGKIAAKSSGSAHRSHRNATAKSGSGKE